VDHVAVHAVDEDVEPGELGERAHDVRPGAAGGGGVARRGYLRGEGCRSAGDQEGGEENWSED
jgi:hypothetical protein